MLHHHACLGVFGDALKPIHGGQRIGAFMVNGRHEAQFAAVAQMIEITRQQHGPVLLEFDLQRLMAWCMAGRFKDKHAAVAENVIVAVDADGGIIDACFFVRYPVSKAGVPDQCAFGMADQEFFDFAWEEVLASTNDHVFDAAHDIDITMCIHRRQVTSV